MVNDETETYFVVMGRISWARVRTSYLDYIVTTRICTQKDQENPRVFRFRKCWKNDLLRGGGDPLRGNLGF